MGEFVRVETEAGIATIRLDRPKMNALNGQVQREIGAAAAEVSADPEVHAVILYGGERLFAAGADVKEMSESGAAEIMDLAAGIQNAFKAVAHIPKPVIAAITGYALGGGLELALCADFRVLGEGAQVGQPEILLGIIPGAGGTQRLPRLIGLSKAKDLVYSGRFVNATEALAIGLADMVVPDAEVYTAARGLAGRYVSSAPLAVRAAKQAIDAGAGLDLDDALEVERLHFTGLFATEDGKAGLRSFLDNGPGKATFSGK
jgi:enoyl-CoA hydratase/carnithine racemase